MTALALDGAQILSAPLNGDIELALLFVGIACSNFGSYGDGTPQAARIANGEDTLEEALRRPISINALARTTGTPFETTRRRCAALEALEVIMRVEGGLIVPPHVMAGPAVREPWLMCRSAMIETIDLLRRAGVDLVALSGEQPATYGLSPMVQAKIILDAVQRTAEHWRKPWEGQLGSYVIHGVLDANVGWLDFPPNDPLAYAFFHTPPPDALRRPVKVAALAKRLGLPISTTRRQVFRLRASGWLSHSDEGDIVTTQTLFDPQFVQNASEFMLHSIRMLSALVSAGMFGSSGC